MSQNPSNFLVQSPIESKGLEKYLSMISHRTMERAVWTFAELRIADLMAHHQAPITAKELSQSNGNNWNAQFLYRLLRIIADANIIEQTNFDDDGQSKHPEDTVQFQLTDDGFLLTSDHYSRARDIVRSDLNPRGEITFAFLPVLIKEGYKNGNAFQQAFGCTFFQYLEKEENKDYATTFHNSMTGYTNHMISSMLSLIDFSRFKRLVDIAGSLGTLLAAVLEKNPNLHGILFDLDHVIAHAKTIDPNEFQRKHIDENRYEFVAGDMFKAETIPPADAYMMKFIIHDWNDEKSVEIFRSIREANKNDQGKIVTIFLIEAAILSNRKENWEAHGMDLEMLTSLSAKERTIAEFNYLFEESDFKLKQLYKTTSAMSIIEGEFII